MIKTDFFISLLVSLLLIPLVNGLVGNKALINGSVLLDEILVAEKRGNFKYGIMTETYEIDKGKIARNEFLSNILSDYNVPYTTINKLVEASKNVFDIRKIRSGKHYSAFCRKDSLEKLDYLVYEPSSIDYVVFSLKDTVSVVIKHKPTNIVEKSAYGRIESSLWNAMVDNKLNPVLSGKLSDIFAWSIDFFGLQQGDEFRIIYNEKFVDTVSVGIESIKSACFTHNGQDFYAIPFKQDSTLAFFDEDGNSLRKAFLKAPLKYSRVSSGFTYRRLHPIYKVYRPHTGVDYAAPAGTPVYALGDGRITKKGYYGGGGNMLKIKHNSVYETAYLHLSRFAKGISPGVQVKQGQLIGYVGSTGASTGPHLDFRVWKNGKPVDPRKIEAPPVEPIKAANRKAFIKTKSRLIEQLKDLSPILAYK